MLSKQAYDGFKSDIWACGVVLYSMLYGEVPFRDTTKEKLNSQILAGDYNLPDTISAEARDLIAKILCVDQDRRYGVEKILNHKWMKKEITKPVSLFTPLELEGIKKVFDQDTMQDTDPLDQSERLLTEHQLDTTCNEEMKNVTTKSVVLAPYNSSRSNPGLETVTCSEYSNKDRVMRFKNGKMKEMDKEYEMNNNANMDNGVYNTEDDKSR